MKLAIFFLFCALACFDSVQSNLILQRHGLPPPPPMHARALAVTWANITQKLDNFNDQDVRTWQMRYLSNGQFFQAGGPIFIMLGAEWTIDPGWLQGGQMFDMAYNHGGYMYYTEHRYYGKSYPTTDLSSRNLEFLTTPQALADVANFIVQLKQKPQFANSKVIIVGGSYGGNMAIWMRETYPNLVHAAVSSSAPVFAKVDFTEYHEVVKKSLQPCASIITNAIYSITEKLGQPGGVEQVYSDFNVCNNLDINDYMDYTTFFSSFANTFAGIVQYAQPQDLVNTCNQLMYSGLDAYGSLAQFMRKRSTGCIGGYAGLRDYMRDISLNRGDSRQWTYQTCTQYGYFQTSETNNHLYLNTVPVGMYYQWCTDFFGPEFTAQTVRNGADKTNMMYGGLNPRVSRVVSVHGTVDPWHSIGLTSNNSPDRPVIVVTGTSHCADLASVSTSDLPELMNAKIAVQTYIANWLKED